jgi:hypothetical protein
LPVRTAGSNGMRSCSESAGDEGCAVCADAAAPGAAAIVTASNVRMMAFIWSDYMRAARLSPVRDRTRCSPFPEIDADGHGLSGAYVHIRRESLVTVALGLDDVVAFVHLDDEALVP